MLTARYLFVGERQSPTAAARGWTWRDGRLCAATLHRALRLAGVDPLNQRWCNLWTTPGLGPTDEPADLTDVRQALQDGLQVVVLGALVAEALAAAGLPHIRLRHPAARGAGRARDHYHRHVLDTLAPH